MLAAGGVIVEVLVTRGFSRQPTRAELEAWINARSLRVTTVMDPPGAGTVTLNTYGQRETGFIVDLATMRVVRKVNGDLAGVSPEGSAVRQLVPEMLRLLGRP